MKTRQKKKSPKRERPRFIGRALLTYDEASNNLAFIEREAIPPSAPLRFLASEPFTVLGLDFEKSVNHIREQARPKSAKWLAVLPVVGGYELERRALEAAGNALSDDASCMQYKSFSRVFEKSCPQVSRQNLQYRFIKCLVMRNPALKRKDTLNRLKTNAAVAAGISVAIILLIAVLIPIGGVSFFGLTIFTTTLFAAIGPAALIPFAIYSALAVYCFRLYKLNKPYYDELADSLSEVFKLLEEIFRAIDDKALMYLFSRFRESPAAYKYELPAILEKRKDLHKIFLDDFTEKVISAICKTASHRNPEDEVTPSEFMDFVLKHPAEIRNSILRAYRDSSVSAITRSFKTATTKKEV